MNGGLISCKNTKYIFADGLDDLNLVEMKTTSNIGDIYFG